MHLSDQRRPIHQVLCHGGFNGSTRCAKVLVRAKGLCVAGGLDAEIDSGLGGPGEVVVEGARGDESACLEELLREREGDGSGDCGGAVEPFRDVGGDGPGGVGAVDWEDWEVGVLVSFEEVR